jgi:two-component system chemotaxis response regulator CheB
VKKVKVLIVHDSVVYRSQIRAALSDLTWVEVVGVASNGRLALERIQQMPVDLLILDLEMPEMNGLQTLKELKQRGVACKVLVFSSASKKGSEGALEALQFGASDFIAKPGPEEIESLTNTDSQPHLRIRSVLEPKIAALFFDIEKENAMAPIGISQAGLRYPSVIWDLFLPKVIVIASSTGGPTVLEKIFSELSPPLKCPILITQHMPPIFTATLAERLEKISGIPTLEGKHGAIIEANNVYVAPGDFHMSLGGTKDRPMLVLNQGPLINSVRPAADPMFSSAAKIFRENCLGIVLTGMGADGKVGAESIKNAGGCVLIQSKSSCVVFGMPGAVMEARAYDRILSPAEIATALKDKAAPFSRCSF